MLVRPRHDRSFDSLPYELFLEIVGYLGEQENIPKRYRAVYVLSQVSRRLHAFTLPILARHITVPTYREFAVVVKHFRERGKARADCVRHIQVGLRDSKISDCGASSLVVICNGFSVPFPNLRSLVYQSSLGGRGLTLLEACPLLSSLHLVWDLAHAFPNVSKWPQLRTLRLRLSTHPAIEPYFGHLAMLPTPRVHSNLTTLAIQNHDLSDWSGCHKSLSFPNLRVLNLQILVCSPREMFHFIHRHPTLLEVNISFRFERDYLYKFESIMKLIDGTGTWLSPENAAHGSGSYSPSETYPKIQLDDLCFDVAATPFSDDPYIVVTTFAFSRVPLFPEATRWDKPFGSHEPRYTATALALLIEPPTTWIDEGILVMLVPEFLEEMHERLPQLEVLRIASGALHDNDWIQVMTDCAVGLRGWKCLRKLSLSWFPGVGSCWDDGFLEIMNGVPMLDETIPPVHFIADSWPFDMNSSSWPYDGVPITFHELRRCYKMNEEPLCRIEPVVKWFLGEEFDIEAHVHDRHVLMDTWEACNAVRVGCMVRGLVECCPTLEEFEWYPVGPFLADEHVRWAWKAHREKDSDKIRMVGDLTWSGCLKGTSSEFLMLVGQELERATATSQDCTADRGLA